MTLWVIRKRPIHQSTAGCNTAPLRWINNPKWSTLSVGIKPLNPVECVEHWSYPTWLVQGKRGQTQTLPSHLVLPIKLMVSSGDMRLEAHSLKHEQQFPTIRHQWPIREQQWRELGWRKNNPCQRKTRWDRGIIKWFGAFLQQPREGTKVYYRSKSGDAPVWNIQWSERSCSLHPIVWPPQSPNLYSRWYWTATREL